MQVDDNNSPGFLDQVILRRQKKPIGVMYIKPHTVKQSLTGVQLGSTGKTVSYLTGRDRPLNRGHILASAPTGPCLVYCPTASSMYKSGIPHSISIRKNGIKKAPVKK